MKKVDVIREVSFASVPEGESVVTRSHQADGGCTEKLSFSTADLKGGKAKAINAKITEMAIRASFGLSITNTTVADESFLFELSVTIVQSCKYRLARTTEKQEVAEEAAAMMLKLRQIVERLNINCPL